MFKDKTVFIIGAGASKEFGLPTGAELVKLVKMNLKFRREMFGEYDGVDSPVRRYLMKTYRGDRNALNLRVDAASQIMQGIDIAESIDEFIFRYSDNPHIAEVGKLQIADSISLAEKNSILGEEKGFYKDISKADGTWISTFFRILVKGRTAREIYNIGDEISIICFNYDRCIEHYLEGALHLLYSMKASEARELVRRMNIIHPYGTLGDLDQVAFGNTNSLSRMADNLITWSETVSDETLLEEIKSAISEAERLVFLGFGFADQNMQLISTNPVARKEHLPRVYASAMGLYPETEESMKLTIHALHSEGMLPGDLDGIKFQYGATCSQFFEIHRFNLQK